MSEEVKKYRSSDRFEIRNARVMWVGEPRAVGDKNLCSAKVVSQPGNDRDMDCWVTFTGADKLGEMIFNLQKGDRVNVSGKPFFSAYLDNDGNPHPTLEIKYPEVDFLTPRRDEVTKIDAEEETEEETEDEKPVVEEKRKPGRPRKNLPFMKE